MLWVPRTMICGEIGKTNYLDITLTQSYKAMEFSSYDMGNEE